MKNNMQVTVTNETIIIKTAYSYSEINAYDQQIFELKYQIHIVMKMNFICIFK